MKQFRQPLNLSADRSPHQYSLAQEPPLCVVRRQGAGLARTVIWRARS